MAKALVIVESPAKAKTINKYLGRDFKVVASMGHVRDLPKSKLGVNIENGFQPEYVVLPDRQKVIKELKELSKDVDDVYVATDPDREGEAIGWHLAEELGAGRKGKVHRLMFNEITKKAILEAIKHPGEIDMRMVDAQQARRVLDRLVGYKISPILWDKVRRGLSAGRVQSVALKLICDREREIEAFVAEEYWHVTARLAGVNPPEFDARLLRKGDAPIKVGNEREASAILADLERATFTVSSIATKERRRQSVPPFITSKLQQASRFPVKKTMMVAQQLYEGIQLPNEEAPVGLITYMRTDSVRVADQALDEVRGHIGQQYGADYVPEQANRFKVKTTAQDAHEAIRPTSMAYHPDAVRAHLTPDQYYLYRLIWNRFVASQMAPAVFDDTTVDITAADYLFRAKGSVPKFAGWLAVYQGTGEADESEKTEQKAPAPGSSASDSDEDAATGVLPLLTEGERLDVKGITPEQKFTQPPPRFNEGSLVKALEENGIGRPSTYASIISVLQARDYVIKNDGRFRPTILGRRLVDKLLHPAFDDILDVEYTARMEDRLDEIEKGKADYEETLVHLLQELQEGPEARRKGNAELQGGSAHRAGLRQVRRGRDGREGRQVRHLPRLQSLSRLRQHQRARAGGSRDRGARRDLRELRTADGCQARPLRDVPRLHRLSRVQDDAEDHRDQARHGSREAGPDPRREVPELRQEPRHQAGPVRRVHGVHRISRVQVRQAEVHGRRLPEGRRRRRGAQVTPRQGLLRVRELSEVRLHAVEQADSRAVPEVWVEVPHREDHQASRPAAHLRQRGLRLRADGRA